MPGEPPPGAPRRPQRIALAKTPAFRRVTVEAALPTQEWTPVKLVFDGESGRRYVEVNGKRNPSIEAVDLSLRYGRVGLGSFDEMGDFRGVRITGEEPK